eukprot:957450-Rhodomonas_salina.4
MSWRKSRERGFLRRRLIVMSLVRGWGQVVVGEVRIQVIKVHCPKQHLDGVPRSSLSVMIGPQPSSSSPSFSSAFSSSA